VLAILLGGGLDMVL